MFAGSFSHMNYGEHKQLLIRQRSGEMRQEQQHFQRCVYSSLLVTVYVRFVGFLYCYFATTRDLSCDMSVTETHVLVNWLEGFCFFVPSGALLKWTQVLALLWNSSHVNKPTNRTSLHSKKPSLNFDKSNVVWCHPVGRKIPRLVMLSLGMSHVKFFNFSTFFRGKNVPFTQVVLKSFFQQRRYINGFKKT